MFLIKSTFWLGLAFVVIQPQNLDFNSKKDALSSAALNAGQKALVSQLNSTNCQTLQCSATKVFINNSTISRTPKTTTPMQKATNITSNHSQLKAPTPLPRLHRTG